MKKNGKHYKRYSLQYVYFAKKPYRYHLTACTEIAAGLHTSLVGIKQYLYA